MKQSLYARRKTNRGSFFDDDDNNYDDLMMMMMMMILIIIGRGMLATVMTRVRNMGTVALDSRC